jgi:hypothetical protein
VTFALLMAGTILATVGFGEHYAIDLVVAVPFACAVASFAIEAPRRLFPLGCLAATVVWMLTLRFSPSLLLTPGLLPLAELVTVAVPLACYWRRGKTTAAPSAVASVGQAGTSAGMAS